MEKEIFKNIPGFEDKYQASNTGKIKSIISGKEAYITEFNNIKNK